MSAEIVVSSATCSDAEAIAHIHSLSWQSAYRHLMSDEYLDNELPEIKRDHWIGVFKNLPEGVIILTASKGDALVGFIAVYANFIPDYDYYIDNIHVLPSLKASGVGKKLMVAAAQKVIGFGKRSIALTVFTENEGAIGFYRKLGGNIVGQGSEVFGGKELPDYLIAWQDVRDLLKI